MRETALTRTEFGKEKAVLMLRGVIAFGMMFVLAATLCDKAEAKTKSGAKPKASSTQKAAPAKKSRKPKPKTEKKSPPRTEQKPAPEPEVPVSAICVEAETGMILFEENADLPRPPASMVKLMQILLVTEGVASGAWKLDQSITVSKNAEGMGGSQVYLKMNDTWPLDTLMQAMAVASANDAAMAVAEGLWGSKEKCLEAMNARAKELGMSATVYRSVHGLPPAKGEEPDVTTARDMATLGRECAKHSEIFRWTGMKEFKLRPEEAPHASTNKMLWTMPDCDGFKTGYIRLAGFCITATAKRNDIRLIAVVMGDDKRGRNKFAEQMMDEGFAALTRKKIVSQGDMLGDSIPVEKCMTPEIKLTAGNDVWVIVKKEDESKIEVVFDRPPKLMPPVAAGTVLGEFRVQLNGTILGKGPLLSPVELKPKTLWERLFGSAPASTNAPAA